MGIRNLGRTEVIGAMALAATLGTLPGLLSAQELEEVVVTAQRRTQSLQDVPISAKVLTADMLERKAVDNIVSLQYAAPSLTVSDYGSANVLNIRGIGRSAVSVELPSGVVIYRDGVPTFPGYFQNEPYYDIASIEVLRGPQGTFVGKSAAGGAIFIRTEKPDLTEFSGKVEGEVGNFDQWGGLVVLNAPVSDQFGLRFAYRHLERNKVLVDSLSGDYTGHPGRPDLNAARIGALWAPNEALSVDLRVDWADLDFGGNLTSSYGFPLYDLVQNANFAYRDETVRAVADIQYKFDNGLVLSSATGYQDTDTINNLDLNGNAPRYSVFNSKGRFELYSQEFNLISPDDTGAFSYVLGVFAQRTQSDIFDWQNGGYNFYGEAGDLGGLVQGSEYPYIGLDRPYTKTEDEWAAFVDFKYSFTDRLEGQVGVRYSNYQLENDTSIILGTGIAPPFIPLFAGVQNLDEDDVDAKVALSYRVTPDQNVYAFVARGHVTGGFNIVGGAEFDKEIIYSYELGWKGSWSQDRVRTQVSAYYQTLSNYQAQFASEDLPTLNILQNGEGDSEMYGFEAALQAQFGPASFDVSIATLDSKLGTFPRVVNPFLPPPNNIVTITGGKTPFAPEFSLNIGGEYEFEINDGLSLTPRVDYGYISEQSGSLIVAPQTHLGARGLLNAQLYLRSGKFYGMLFGTNLTDERYVAGIQNSGTLWYPGAPRQYGLRVGYDF